MLADVIFHGGTILTVDDDFSQVEAVAVVGDKIAAVGTLADLEGLRGPDTRDIDLLGATMLPGFVEAHGHPTLEMSMIGPGSIDVRATVCGTTEEVMRRLRERIDNAKPGEWIAAFGWDPLMLTDLPPISGVWLDELSPNNPISIMHNSAHGTWVNKLALEQLGITKDTPNPTASEYVRDENGELTGEAREIPACFNFMGPAMAVTDETFGDFMSNEMHRFNSAGVTTSGDLGFPKEGMFDWVRKYADAGKSTLRIRAYEMSDASLASPRSPGVGDAMFRQIGIKCWADGSPWIGNIQTSFPYQDSSYTRAIGVEPGHKGGANYTREAFTELVRAYFSKG